MSENEHSEFQIASFTTLIEDTDFIMFTQQKH